ncbi:hypothetical protein FNH22_21190 [Fulvivirga sp. M361]|uniref:DUF6452 family protein n=1 Tax=Fulvivirga sp. M361 TaxID=2594266 RepID=UPI00117ACDCC|nr:DUF6452 family protein [Fulvivirga sp. M361]TRX53028.1 hypothetical protein FNH22_21190 [Fulvivirga sp. M361]
MTKKFQKLSLLLVSVLILTFSLTLSGCLDCDGLKTEPELIVEFFENTQFTRVYGLKSTIEPISPDSNDSYILPVDASNSKTTYIFESADKTDTLEVLYEIDVSFESKRCGFTQKLEKLELGANTTFRSAQINDQNNIVIQ